MLRTFLLDDAKFEFEYPTRIINSERQHYELNTRRSLHLNSYYCKPLKSCMHKKSNHLMTKHIKIPWCSTSQIKIYVCMIKFRTTCMFQYMIPLYFSTVEMQPPCQLLLKWNVVFSNDCQTVVIYNAFFSQHFIL